MKIKDKDLHNNNKTEKLDYLDTSFIAENIRNAKLIGKNE